MVDTFPHENEYVNLWNEMDINPKDLSRFQEVAEKAFSFKDRYLPISSKTGVPWDVIALMHYRESNFNFKKHLHNGDPLSARTVRVPKGYPKVGSPPYSFQTSAIDALKLKNLDKISDWSIARKAFVFEQYNGFGYRNKGVNSPYLWAGTDQYKKGKYVADHVFDRNVVDKQLGVMGIFKVLQDLDPSLKDEVPELIADTQEDTEENITSSTKAEQDYDFSDLMSNSRKFFTLTWLKRLFGVGAGGTVALKSASDADVEVAKSATDIIMQYGVYALIIVLVIIIIVLNKQQENIKEDIKEGRYKLSKE